MLKRIAQILSIYTVLLSIAICSYAEAMPAKKTSGAQALQTLLVSLQSLSGKFTQTLVDQQGDLLQESHGEFFIKRPGKFYWRTYAPFEQVLVTDQETLWLYDPDLEQVTVRPFDSRLQQTPALLLSGDVNQLADAFEIQLNTAHKGEQKFVLTPRDEDTLFDTLSLTFTNNQLSGMQLLDGLGQKTHFLISELQSNPVIEDSVFHFQAPPGTDVLIDEQP